MSAPAADALTALLAQYGDPAPAQAARLLHVPPPVAARALELLPADLPTARLNLVRPPMTWLADQAAQLGGRLVGSLTAERGLVTFDGIQVDAATAPELAARVAADWPAAGNLPAARIRHGRDLDMVDRRMADVVRPVPAGTAVVGLGWD